MPDYLLLFLSIFILHYFSFLIKILKGLKSFDNKFNLKTEDEFISVIIPFRNESENILMSLQSVESLDYPNDKYEVIYVDDDSEDDSFTKLCNAISSPNIKVIKAVDKVEYKAHKKRAVELGIERSKGEIIVTTDADCRHSPEWLKYLISTFDNNTAMAAGPVDLDRK